MIEADINAAILFLAVTLYAVFGGADFGSGLWDLTAGGAERGARPRALIEDSIGAIWEVNHVWIVFSLVVCWTAFSPAFSAVMLTLFVPLLIAALGIVMRGSSFAFRRVVFRTNQRRLFGGAFAISSVIVPFCFGAIAGAIASGRVPAGGDAGDYWGSWLNPTSIVGGVLAVIACAYISGVFLVFEARRRDEPELQRYFTVRAIGAAIAAGVVATVGIFVINADAEFLADNLLGRALPLVIVSAILGLAALALLIRHAARGARLVAIGAVACVMWAWAVAQWPYILPETLEIDDAAAPSETLTAIIVVFVVFLVIVGPSMVFLFSLQQRGGLHEIEEPAGSDLSV